MNDIKALLYDLQRAKEQRKQEQLIEAFLENTKNYYKQEQAIAIEVLSDTTRDYIKELEKELDTLKLKYYLTQLNS